MKLLNYGIVLSFVLAASSSFAQILNSDLEERHQKAIIQTIEQRCGLSGNWSQISNLVETIHVDNGITDYKFLTHLVLKVRIDQIFFDSYHINVHSSYADLYDHSSGNWGAYSVDSVTSHDVSCNF